MVYTCTACKHSYRIPAAPILEPGQAPTASGPDPGPALMAASAIEVDSMPQSPTQSISEAAATTDPSSEQKKKKKRKDIPRRLPALFARDVGHVVFAGNEQLPSSNGSWNDGIFIT